MSFGVEACDDDVGVAASDDGHNEDLDTFCQW